MDEKPKSNCVAAQRLNSLTDCPVKLLVDRRGFDGEIETETLVGTYKNVLPMGREAFFLLLENGVEHLVNVAHVREMINISRSGHPIT
jgi:hypothetical protein